MGKLRAGRLRHKIIIQREEITKDTFGAVVKSWVNIKVTRASINPVTGNEVYLSSHISNEVDHEIVIRATDVIPADRIIFQNRIFNLIRTLNVNERGNMLLILAKENLKEKYASALNVRVTESGDTRITEASYTRITED